MMRPMHWNAENKTLTIVDQTMLPIQLVEKILLNYEEVAEAIKILAVRGAPAIGVAASYGIAIAARSLVTLDNDAFYTSVRQAMHVLGATRPTAVNLFWAIKRMGAVLENLKDSTNEQVAAALEAEAIEIEKEDYQLNLAMGQNGAELIPDGATVLTHCNAGALATAGHGTALGVIRSAVAQGKKIKVFADETRPLLQGARLTTWELMQDGIDVTLITDSMAGHFMKSGEIDLVIVGADRIAANGDTANKIGTYGVAVLAKEHGIPFYVAAPYSTFDLSLKSGDLIPIEERSHDEVANFAGCRTAPEGIKVRNPAFDVTPNKYITAIITEKGILRPPFNESLKCMSCKE